MIDTCFAHSFPKLLCYNFVSFCYNSVRRLPKLDWIVKLNKHSLTEFHGVKECLQIQAVTLDNTNARAFY